MEIAYAVLVVTLFFVFKVLNNISFSDRSTTEVMVSRDGSVTRVTVVCDRSVTRVRVGCDRSVTRVRVGFE